MSEDYEPKFSEEHPIATLMMFGFFVFIIFSLFSCSYNEEEKDKMSFCEESSKTALTMKQSKDNGIPYDSQLNLITIVNKGNDSNISYYKKILDITYKNKDTDNIKFGLIVKDMCLTEHWRIK